MSKYKQQESKVIIDDAMKIAKGIQKPGQTKEQTKLIAQGIQKGIAEYKKQQKSKAKDLDKLKKKLNQQQQSAVPEGIPADEAKTCKSPKLAWALLVLTWLGIVIFILTSKLN